MRLVVATGNVYMSGTTFERDELLRRAVAEHHVANVNLRLHGGMIDVG